ncbi:MAG TPA: hypothetical protein VEJ17_00470 [Candidatus Nitrosotalea sp.]|nr:hypothetical protein [Candidatus Nitrosotalea sp.]
MHPERTVITTLGSNKQATRTKTELHKIGYFFELYGTPRPGAENVSPAAFQASTALLRGGNAPFDDVSLVIVEVN